MNHKLLLANQNRIGMHSSLKSKWRRTFVLPRTWPWDPKLNWLLFTYRLDVPVKLALLDGYWSELPMQIAIRNVEVHSRNDSADMAILRISPGEESPGCVSPVHILYHDHSFVNRQFGANATDDSRSLTCWYASRLLSWLSVQVLWFC